MGSSTDFSSTSILYDLRSKKMISTLRKSLEDAAADVGEIWQVIRDTNGLFKIIFHFVKCGLDTWTWSATFPNTSTHGRN